MDTLYLYVDPKTNFPLWMHRDVHPFYVPEGTIDTNYTNFTVGVSNPEAFDVPGIDKCPIGDDS